MLYKVLDKYSLKARLIPALLVLLPLCVSLASIFPTKFAGWDLIVWLGTSMGLGIFLEQLARDCGITKQRNLFKKWQGEPAVLVLRHSDGTFDQHTKKRFHHKLSQLLNLQIPSPEQEKKDPSAADQIYKSCVCYLISSTRDREKFYLIFEESINYGFRRNLWGMKVPAITLIFCSLALLIFINWSLPTLSPATIVAGFFNFSLLIAWLFYITPKWIKITAEAYSKQLISALDINNS